MVPFWSIWGSKTANFEVLGPPGGRLGAILDPMAGQRGARSQKGTKRLTLGTPFRGPFSVVFRICGCFFGGLISSRFLDGFWARFLKGFGVIFWDMFWICGVTLSMRPRKWKMRFGLIICYESSTCAFADTGGKSHKILQFGRTFLGRPWGRHFLAFLAPFWDHCGAKIAKQGGPKIDKKWGLAAPGLLRVELGVPRAHFFMFFVHFAVFLAADSQFFRFCAVRFSTVRFSTVRSFTVMNFTVRCFTVIFFTVRGNS